MTRTTRVAVAVLLAAGLVTAATGCGTSPTSPPAPETTATAETAPPVETPAAPTIVSGTVLTAEQLVELPKDVRAHTMADGSFIATVAGEPIPQVVVDDVAAVGQPLVIAMMRDSAGADSTPFMNLQDKIGIELGRKVIWVVEIVGGHPNYAPETTGTFYSTAALIGTSFRTREEAMATADAYVAKTGVGNFVVFYPGK